MGAQDSQPANAIREQQECKNLLLLICGVRAWSLPHIRFS